MIVMFEGPDAAGKDLVRREFEQLTKYEHTCITRFVFSQMVYAQYFKRKQFANVGDFNAYQRFVRKFLLEFNPLVVYVRADVNTLKNRIEQRGEDWHKQPDSTTVMHLFERAFRDLGVDHSPRFIQLDTTFDPDLSDLASRIANKIKSLEKGRRIAHHG